MPLLLGSIPVHSAKALEKSRAFCFPGIRRSNAWSDDVEDQKLCPIPPDPEASISMSHFIYIIQSDRDGSFYIGSSSDPKWKGHLCFLAIMSNNLHLIVQQGDGKLLDWVHDFKNSPAKVSRGLSGFTLKVFLWLFSRSQQLKSRNCAKILLSIPAQFIIKFW